MWTAGVAENCMQIIKHDMSSRNFFEKKKKKNSNKLEMC